MKTRQITPFILATLILYGCSLFQAKLNEDYKRDDLKSAVVDSLDRFANDSYKMNPNYTNDFIVALIRRNALNVATSKEYVKILINILSIRNSDYINESWILKHLDSKQQKEYHRDFPDGLPARQSIDDIVQNSPFFKDTITCKAEEVDAHWAYFSATGDTKAVEKMKKTLYVFGIPCCFRCLEWSLPSRASQNKDVYDKLIEIRDTDCASSKDPKECISYYNERFIPPTSECEWRNQDFFNFK